MHVTGLEVVFGDTIVGEDVESGSLCLVGRGKHAGGLIAIEEVGGLAHLGADGGAIECGLHVVGAVGQGGHLVLIVSECGTCLPLEVFHHEELAAEADVEAGVFELTVIAPVAVETREEVELLEHEQIACAALVSVEAYAHAVVEQTGVEADVGTSSSLPLHFRVTDTGDGLTGDGVDEELGAEIAVGSVVADVVVATHVVAGGQTQVVEDVVAGEPGLVGHHPCSLHGGEDAPDDAGHLQAAVSMTAEERGALGREVGSEEVTVQVVVLCLGIPVDAAPLLVGTVAGGVHQAGAHERGLIGTGVVA